MTKSVDPELERHPDSMMTQTTQSTTATAQDAFLEIKFPELTAPTLI